MGDGRLISFNSKWENLKALENEKLNLVVSRDEILVKIEKSEEIVFEKEEYKFKLEQKQSGFINKLTGNSDNKIKALQFELESVNLTLSDFKKSLEQIELSLRQNNDEIQDIKIWVETYDRSCNAFDDSNEIICLMKQQFEYNDAIMICDDAKKGIFEILKSVASRNGNYLAVHAQVVIGGSGNNYYERLIDIFERVRADFDYFNEKYFGDINDTSFNETICDVLFFGNMYLNAQVGNLSILSEIDSRIVNLDVLIGNLRQLSIDNLKC